VNIWFLSIVGVACLLVLGLGLLRWRYILIHVRGTSMLPTFKPGDRVLVRSGIHGRLHVGTIVVIRSPVDILTADPFWPGVASGLWIIKRIAALPGDPVPADMRAAAGETNMVPPGMFMISADNSSGVDSRNLGFLPISDILGAVVSSPGMRYRPARSSEELRARHGAGTD